MPRRSARSLWASHLKAAAGASRKPAAAGSPPDAPLAGIILGIDPSLRGTGLAVLSVETVATVRLLASETVRTPAEAGLPECLGVIARAVEGMIERFALEAVAVEETIYVQNFRTAQKLGAARGAAIGMAAWRGLPVFEYSPLRIKQAVAGYGRASKEQVAGQMAGLLRLKAALPFDESDAAAAAYCHAVNQRRKW